ncbi:MAG: hypothetical protein DMF63_00680 [Acidobacteria bacterium]|nr:MAG: hypothetical protein DMF63_00680 [Acidobacteriota bacterium]
MGNIFIALCVVMGLLFFAAATSEAQHQREPSEGLHSALPSTETFVNSDGLVGSWMGCGKMPDDRPEHGCNKVEYSKEFMNAQNFALYNQDGTLWWGASRIENDDYRERGQEYFGAKPKEGFKPLFSNGRDIVLRLVSESSTWFEVEINETTRKTKFISKTDPAWYKTTWDFWLRLNYEILLYPDQRLRDAPKGKPIEVASGQVINSVNFLKMDGEWAFVEEREPSPGTERVRGWVRWRKGREILIREFLNRLSFGAKKRN